VHPQSDSSCSGVNTRGRLAGQKNWTEASHYSRRRIRPSKVSLLGRFPTAHRARSRHVFCRLAEGGASQEQTTSAHLSATHKTLNSDLQQNMRAAFLGMPSFYRLEIVESRPPTVRRAAFFAQRLENWLTASNHNHLKIAKILKSMPTQGWKLRLLRFSIVLPISTARSQPGPAPLTKCSASGNQRRWRFTSRCSPWFLRFYVSVRCSESVQKIT
jgi:hypothetical protein